MNPNTLVPNTPTTIGSWALLIAKAFESYQLDSAALFEQAEIDLVAIQRNPELRLPVSKMSVLWQLAVEQCQDPAFALRLTQFFQPSTYSAVGLAVASSRNVLEGLERCLRYFKLTTDAANYRLEKGDEFVILSIEILPNYPVAVEAIEAFSSTLISLFRMMSGADFSPLQVSYCHDKATHHHAYQQFFNCPVSFNQATNQIVFSRADTEQAQMLANPSLVNTLEQWIVQYLAQYSGNSLNTCHGELSSLVQSYILENILSGDVDIHMIADSMNLGVRTLQRKLKLEGNSFNQLFDHCRHHLALKLLTERQVPLIEIAFMLGFSDQSNFTRAFKRWAGINPKDYRLQQQAC